MSAEARVTGDVTTSSAAYLPVPIFPAGPALEVPLVVGVGAFVIAWFSVSCSDAQVAGSIARFRLVVSTGGPFAPIAGSDRSTQNSVLSEPSTVATQVRLGPFPGGPVTVRVEWAAQGGPPVPMLQIRAASMGTTENASLLAAEVAS